MFMMLCLLMCLIVPKDDILCFMFSLFLCVNTPLFCVNIFSSLAICVAELGPVIVKSQYLQVVKFLNSICPL